MERRNLRRRNWAILAVLTLVLLAALVVVVLALADPATKGRLYGWLPSGEPVAAPVPAHP